LKKLEEILKNIEIINKKINKLNQTKKGLKLELQNVCLHDDIKEFYDYDYPKTYYNRFCKICGKDLR
jgi:hypothetical protein